VLNFGPILSAPLAGNPSLQAVHAAINGLAARPSAVAHVTFGRNAAIAATARRPGAVVLAQQLLGTPAVINARTTSPHAAVSVSSQTAARIQATLTRPGAVVHAAQGISVSLSAHTAMPHGAASVARGVGVTVRGTTHAPVSTIKVARGVSTSIAGHTLQTTAQIRAGQGVAATIRGATRMPVGQGAGTQYPYGVQISGIASAPLGSWSVYASNPIPGIGAELAYLTRIATSLPGVMPGPPLLKALRGGSIEARTVDFTPELITTADGLISIIGITVSRVDGSVMGPSDLMITPPYYTPPWLAGTMLNPATGTAIGAAIVGWWCTAGLAVAAAGPVFYKVSVSVTTANGSTLTRDLYQVVTDALGSI